MSKSSTQSTFLRVIPAYSASNAARRAPRPGPAMDSSVQVG